MRQFGEKIGEGVRFRILVELGFPPVSRVPETGRRVDENRFSAERIGDEMRLGIVFFEILLEGFQPGYGLLEIAAHALDVEVFGNDADKRGKDIEESESRRKSSGHRECFRREILL